VSQPPTDERAGGPGSLADDDLMVLAEVDAGLILDVWEPTGEPRVDESLDLLDLLEDDVNQHPAVFDRIHQGLRATLADLDSASG
jgi:hypothetical protein